MGCLSFLSFMAPLLGGCISTKPKDLAFVSVRVVDRHDQLEIMPPSADPALGLINESQRKKLLAEAGPIERPHQLLLKIEFSSHTNLAEFMRDHSFNLGSHAFFCGRPKDEVILSGLSVYWNGVWLNGLERDPIKASGGGNGELITYYFFSSVAREEKWEWRRPGLQVKHGGRAQRRHCHSASSDRLHSDPLTEPQKILDVVREQSKRSPDAIRFN